MNNQTRNMFSTPVKKAVDVYVVGEIYTKDGKFLRSIYYYGKNPKEALS